LTSWRHELSPFGQGVAPVTLSEESEVDVAVVVVAREAAAMIVLPTLRSTVLRQMHFLWLPHWHLS